MINKILIIGYGSIGKKYYKIIKSKYKKINLCVYTKQNNLNINKIKSFSEIILFKPDLTILCNPSSKRKKIYNILKKTNTHILFEKPITNNYESSKNIFEKNNKIFRVGYNLRQLNILKKFKTLIKKRKIGKIYSFHIEAGHYLPFWRKRKYHKTVTAQKKLGGGVNLELSHEIDYAIWIFGKIKKIKSFYGKQSNLKINTEDTSKIILLNANNIIGSIFLDCTSFDKKRYCHVFGSSGELYMDIIKNQIKYKNNKSKKWSLIFKGFDKVESSYFKQLKEMIKLINNKSKVSYLSTVSEAKYILQLINRLKSK